MKLNFNIEYQTVFGEELVLNLIKKEGACDQYHMNTLDGSHWSYEMSKKFKVGDVIDYYYSVERGGVVARHEWLTEVHRLELVSEKGVNYTIYDHWIDMPEDSYLYSSAFTDCVAKHTIVKSPVKAYSSTIRIKVRAPQLREGERLAIIGDDPIIGGWEIKKAVDMTEHHFNEWMVNIDATRLQRPVLEFKFVVLDEIDDVSPLWEEGMNRTIVPPLLNDGDVV